MKKYSINVNGKKYEVEVELMEDDGASPFHNLPSAPDMPYHPAPETRDAFRPAEYKPPVKHVAKAKELTCPINGVMVEIFAKVGSTIKEKDIVASIEAMKMKTSVYSNQFGIVKTIDVKVGDTVENGQVILTFE